jgi:outer membrane receptor protein involved in Fe transport
VAGFTVRTRDDSSEISLNIGWLVFVSTRTTRASPASSWTRQPASFIVFPKSCSDQLKPSVDSDCLIQHVATALRPLINKNSFLRALAVALVASTATLHSASPAEAQAPAARLPSAGPGQIQGRIVDQSGNGLVAGSVTLRRATDTAFVSGALPTANGNFRIEGIAPGRYHLRIRLLGYAPLDRNDVVITAAQPVVDLGSLTLSRVSVTLESQVIAGERSQAELAPDRNTYSVRNMPAVAGGNAVDALRATPAVEVDATDNVSLRGNSNVVVQINGRPSPLKGDQLAQFLKQIPTSVLDRIEVATNPNAKSDPEGTAGIINIVLKQDIDIGISAGVNVSGGTTGLANGSINLARQKGPLTLYGAVYGYRDNRSQRGSVDRANLLIPVPAFLSEASTGSQRPKSFGTNLRADYKFTKIDDLNAEAYIFGNQYLRSVSSAYSDFDPQRALIGQFSQGTDFNLKGGSVEGVLSYRRTLANQQTPWASILTYGNYFNTRESDVLSEVFQSDPSTAGLLFAEQLDHQTSRYPTLTWQNDYSRQFSPAFKVDAGVKATWRRSINDQTTVARDSAAGPLVAQPGLASASDYKEQFDAAYALVSEKWKSLSFQQGLRMEDTWTHLALPGSGVGALTNHYVSPFPSAIVTWNTTSTSFIKASYARRISRPFPQFLSSIPVRTDQRTLFVGNPKLRPEYLNAYELTLQESPSWGSIQVVPYFRRSTDAVRVVQRVDSTGTATSMPDNVAQVSTTGADLNIAFHRGPVTMNVGGSGYRYVSDAANLGPTYSVHTGTWSGRANGSYKFPTQTLVQFFMFYNPARHTEGATSLSSAFSSIGVRQPFAAGKGNVTLTFQDPFSLQRFGQRLSDGTVIQTSVQHFGSRALVISVSRTFGSDIKLQPVPPQPDASAPPPPAGG